MPYVIEPAAGADRATLAFLVDAYDEEQVEGETRTVLKLHPRLGAGQGSRAAAGAQGTASPERAREVFDALRKAGLAGRVRRGRLDRQAATAARDEIGTPWCVTIDHETLEDATVTVRERDSLAQERVAIDALPGALGRPPCRPLALAEARLTAPRPATVRSRHMAEQPLRLTVTDDDLERSRATVAFRLILAIPHLIVLGVVGGVAVLIAFLQWWAVLFTGRPNKGMAEFHVLVVRCGVQVYAYLTMSAQPWPPFLAMSDYVVDAQIEIAERLSRWKAAFRIVLALPALALAGAMGGGAPQARLGGSGGGGRAEYAGAGILAVVGVLAWFACLARGRMPRGLRDLALWAIGYVAQTYAYMFLLTDHYPDPNPALRPVPDPPEHPVTMSVAGDLHRTRMTVFFRLPLAVPHLIWVTLWAIVAGLASVVGWLCALVLGRLPAPLHRFQAAFLRYTTQLYGFLTLVTNPFPGFTGTPGANPLELTLPPPERQGRWSILFRLVLAVPAFAILSGLAAVGYLCTLFSWWVALFTGREPIGLRNATAYWLRYGAQASAYPRPAHAALPLQRLRAVQRLRAGGLLTHDVAPRSIGAALLAVAVLAGAVVAGVLLWHTSVPGDLALPHLDVAKVFPVRATARAASFERFEDIDFVLSQVVLVAVLVVYARRGARYMSESAAGPIGTGFLLGMLGFALVWLARLPFDVAAFWWEKRHGVLDTGWVTLLVGDWASLITQFAFVCFALLVAMGLARWLGRAWWAPAAAAFAGLALLFAFLSPALTTLRDPHGPALRAEAAKVARAEGVPGVPLKVEDTRDASDEPNAYSFGLGSTRTVVLWDTIVGFPRRELDVVVAHEYGHQARDHIAKSVGWEAIVLALTAFVVSVATRGRGGMARPEAVPVALLAFVVVSLLLTPLQSAASRRYEAEADWVALNTTHDPAAMEALMRRFTVKVRSDPDPPGWFHTLFDDHPSGLERVEMARAFAARQRALAGRLQTSG